MKYQIEENNYKKQFLKLNNSILKYWCYDITLYMDSRHLPALVILPMAVAVDAWVIGASVGVVYTKVAGATVGTPK